MYFFGRGISAFFNQFFKWLFWNKTGQKLLFSILIVFIFFCFIKLGEVSAVEEVEDINYEVKSYYDGVVNDAIVRLYRLYNNGVISKTTLQTMFAQNLYFYYGNISGSGYANSRPLNTRYLYILRFPKNNDFFSNATITANDYLGVTGYTLYNVTALPSNSVIQKLDGSGYIQDITSSFTNVFYPYFAFNYTSDNWVAFVQAINNNDNEAIIELLDSINESLTNTEPTSETDSFVEVDSSSVDDLSSSSVDNVFSTMTTGFANKFTNYDLSTVNSFIWNLNGTRITFYSDTLYKMIRGTFFETLLSMLWYYIFGHYAFVWLSNIIHKIKDGSILDGLEVNEVITKEML